MFSFLICFVSCYFVFIIFRFSFMCVCEKWESAVYFVCFIFVLCEFHYLSILLNLVNSVAIFDNEAGYKQVVLYFVIFNFVIDHKQVLITIKLKIILILISQILKVLVFYYFCQKRISMFISCVNASHFISKITFEWSCFSGYWKRELILH